MRLDRRARVAAGIALAVAGAYLVHSAYEGAGRRRPFALRLLPV